MRTGNYPDDYQWEHSEIPGPNRRGPNVDCRINTLLEIEAYFRDLGRNLTYEEIQSLPLTFRDIAMDLSTEEIHELYGFARDWFWEPLHALTQRRNASL